MSIDTENPTTENPTSENADTDLAAGDANAGTGEPVELVRVEADPDRVQHLDPRGLLTDRNVRHSSAADAAADRRMAASVRDAGVLQPIIAFVTDEGYARVRIGHRRTRGAIAAGAATVPVIVRASQADAEQAEAERIASQITENDVRQGLSPAEQLAAFADLAALGKTPGQIAKMTKARRRDVVDALKAAESPEVRDAVAGANLTLEQGATLAEFADDDEAYGALLDTATGGGRSWESFEHLAARLREDRAEKAQRAALLAELAAAGVVVVSAPARRFGHRPRQPHQRPRPGTGPATADPGPSRRRSPRPSTPTAPDTRPSCAAATAGRRRSSRCTRAPTRSTHGHRARRSYVRLTTPAGPPAREDETPEQAAARAAATKEAETAQRRRVLAGNRAWRAAETVRRDHLRTLLARKTPPKGSGPYLATTLTLDPFAITKAAEKGHELAAALLTGQQDIAGRERVAALAEGTSDARGQVIALGLILAGIEASTGVHSWRHADDRHGSDWRGESSALGRYLRFLVATGYPLAPIERFAIGEDVDEADVFTPPGTDPGDLDIADDDPDDPRPEVDPDVDAAEQEAADDE